MTHALFCDGSVNTTTGFGVGVFLWLDDFSHPLSTHSQNLQTHYFENTSSTRLELEILLQALKTSPSSDNTKSITVYTDCQNTIQLPQRRQRLEKNQYISAKGKKLNNADLYQQFYQHLD